MRHASSFILVVAALSLGGSSFVHADNLTNAHSFLCTAVQTTRCDAGGDCIIAPPWDLNIPQFIEVDLDAKRIATTKASGMNRATPIRSLTREDGMIYLQGVEGGRAFSIVITEATGETSIAVAREGISVSIFGACTPTPQAPAQAK